MPGFDQTGPNGQGSMTGRKMGKCANLRVKQKEKPKDTERDPNGTTEATEDFQGRGYGNGQGRRRKGFGRGMQRRFRGNG